MTNQLMEWGKNNIHSTEIIKARVLEVGSYNVNGTFRTIIEPFEPMEYIGVDMAKGPCVDQICNIHDLTKKFLPNSFDVVVCTEVLEHVQDWKNAVCELKNVLKPGGILYVTAPAPGFVYHAYPTDHWRYTVEDFKKIFAEFIIVSTASVGGPASCIKAVKSSRLISADLVEIKVAPVKR